MLQRIAPDLGAHDPLEIVQGRTVPFDATRMAMSLLGAALSGAIIDGLRERNGRAINADVASPASLQFGKRARSGRITQR